MSPDSLLVVTNSLGLPFFSADDLSAMFGVGKDRIYQFRHNNQDRPLLIEHKRALRKASLCADLVAAFHVAHATALQQERYRFTQIAPYLIRLPKVDLSVPPFPPIGEHSGERFLALYKTAVERAVTILRFIDIPASVVELPLEDMETAVEHDLRLFRDVPDEVESRRLPWKWSRKRAERYLEHLREDMSHYGVPLNGDAWDFDRPDRMTMIDPHPRQESEETATEA
ncbi:hypothetical protein [Candidatus Macondimonas diazotrophica]|uniref:Uncharacterized protein n=1 Tax=Candidatus Macondimonas diazotrophica TaxID=2305248 RepID=A0A4Z0F6J8_9GAMM|nr:hypothetical protein [Candidatus Macondimonas diazotrophica]TFZ81295.1 hypothetical protein E4680_13085 [Candidatus Macondimonas diazotrophica]